MGARSIRVAAAGVVLLMVLRTCAVFCVVSAESTEQTFNVSQRDGELLSRVDENIDGVVDQYMSSTADEAGSAEEFNGESYDDDEGAVSVGIDQRAGIQRRFLVQKKEKPAHHGDHCWKDAHCRSRQFRKPGCCKKCVDLYSDTMHCGKCGEKCKAGFRCVEGKCEKLPEPKRCGVHAECKKGSTCCNNKSCVNLYSDAMHCGKCGEKCKAGYRCDEGKCEKLPQPKRCGLHAECMKGSTCCNNKSCVNLYSDAMHCGKCGEKCKAGYRCDEGKCEKLPGPKRCGVHAECKKGSTCCENKCVKLNGSDKFNCGKCGRKCGFGSVCCTGECKYIFRSDAEHCGGCHKRCKHGVKCTYGICGYN